MLSVPLFFEFVSVYFFYFFPLWNHLFHRSFLSCFCSCALRGVESWLTPFPPQSASPRRSPGFFFLLEVGLVVPESFFRNLRPPRVLTCEGYWVFVLSGDFMFFFMLVFKWMRMSGCVKRLWERRFIWCLRCLFFTVIIIIIIFIFFFLLDRGVSRQKRVSYKYMFSLQVYILTNLQSCFACYVHMFKQYLSTMNLTYYIYIRLVSICFVQE